MPEPQRLMLHWQAPDDCPSPDAFKASIAAASPQVEFVGTEPAGEIEVRIQSGAEGVVGELSLSRPDQQFVARRVVGASCAEVVEALRFEELAAYMCEQRIEYVLYGRSEQRQRAELFELANATPLVGLETAITVETSDGRAATRLLRLDPQRCPHGAGQRSPVPPSAPLLPKDTLTSTL